MSTMMPKPVVDLLLDQLANSPTVVPTAPAHPSVIARPPFSHSDWATLAAKTA